jgi:hypothetical protein
MNRELLTQEIVEVSITEQGQTQEQAYQNIFNRLRKEIHNHIDGYLVEMHVESFKVTKKDVLKKVKRFLFFFMPVEHTSYVISATLKVSVSLLLK